MGHDQKPELRRSYRQVCRIDWISNRSLLMNDISWLILQPQRDYVYHMTPHVATPAGEFISGGSSRGAVMHPARHEAVLRRPGVREVEVVRAHARTRVRRRRHVADVARALLVLLDGSSSLARPLLEARHLLISINSPAGRPTWAMIKSQNCVDHIDRSVVSIGFRIDRY